MIFQNVKRRVADRQNGRHQQRRLKPRVGQHQLAPHRHEHRQQYQHADHVRLGRIECFAKHAGIPTADQPAQRLTHPIVAAHDNGRCQTAHRETKPAARPAHAGSGRTRGRRLIGTGGSRAAHDVGSSVSASRI